VPAGAVADEVVVLDGDGLRLVALTDDARRPVANLGSSPLAVCWFETEGERVDGGRVLASGAAARAEHARAVDEWRVLTAAALVGLAQGALDLAVAHVCTRQQFGVPIGSFQAVQHRLADLVTDLDGARLLVWEAAWAADADSQRAAELAAMAFVWAASTATRVATESLHFHGGYGFTLEHDIQLFFRRAKAWPLALDDPDRELQRLGDLLYGRER
jgi:alkylation response protein AidB-like acyl-CoA dehydrogenase